MFNFTNFILNIVFIQYNLVCYKHNIILLFVFKILHKLLYGCKNYEEEIMLFIICIFHSYF